MAALSEKTSRRAAGQGTSLERDTSPSSTYAANTDQRLSHEAPSTDVEMAESRQKEEASSDSVMAETAPGTKAPFQPDVPDGGLAAWLNNAGAFFSFFASFGIVNSYGVFQDNYKANRLDQQNDSVIALIGAMQLFLLYGCGPIVGKIFDSYGILSCLPPGAFCIVFSLMMLSLAQPNQLYQYFLAQAILFGIGCSLVFTSSLAHMGHYFKRRRPLAIGIVAAGSSLGGVVFPIVLQRLIPRIGFGWAVRVMAFIALACFIFAIAVSRSRLPLRKVTRRDMLRAIDLGGFRDPRYCLAAVSAFLTFYAIFIPYFYIQQYAELRGMSSDLAIYLLPMINSMGIISRVLPAIFAPRIGVLNLMILFTSIAGILVLALWLPSSGNASIIVFALTYGFFSGPFISLLPAYIGVISPQPVYGARLGAMYLVVAVACLVGTPTGGALVGSGSLEHYQHLIGFTGALVIAGSAVLVAIWLIDVRTLIREHKSNKPDRPMRWTDFKV